ncbi:hypothetical protein CWI39_2517p0010 [Hamiltosporidium magnivora]|uniref:Uncharacterized protein n=1 Tax=Hamiltosporidium magnivora TaxID=148818 RepID=A0A4Q9KTW5_9MICR|nr:hypothetical protein CWI39_2517p0010 [Hamiltosporidium magnivora]
MNMVKKITPIILKGGTALEEPTINIIEESDLEKETVMVKRGRRKYLKILKKVLT